MRIGCELYAGGGRQRRCSAAAALLLLLWAPASVHGLSRVSMTENGGYNNIVIKIRKEVNEDDCPDILRGIKVLIKPSQTLRVHKHLLTYNAYWA